MFMVSLSALEDLVSRFKRGQCTSVCILSTALSEEFSAKIITSIYFIYFMRMSSKETKLALLCQKLGGG